MPQQIVPFAKSPWIPPYILSMDVPFLLLYIWYFIVSWLSFDFMISRDISSLFWQFTHVVAYLGWMGFDTYNMIHNYVDRLRFKKPLHIISTPSLDFRRSIDRIISLSWRWFLDRSTYSSCLFYEWFTLARYHLFIEE